MDQTPQEPKTVGVDLMGLIMTSIQVIGVVVAILLLERFTPLPFWACMIIGIPSFFVVFWVALYFLVGRGDSNPPSGEEGE